MEKLQNEINQNFEEALDQVLPKIKDLIDGNLEENESDDNQNPRTQITVQPKIRIECDASGGYVLRIEIPVKEIRKVVGKSESCWQDGQEELPLDGKE